jgi:hypothetical protein
LGANGLGRMEPHGFAWRREGAFRRPRTAPAFRVAAPFLAIVMATSLSGCASISQKFADTAGQMPGIGLPANAPERPSSPVAFPAVHDIPPPRNSVTLTNFEQQKLEDDLLTARDQQQSAAGVPLQPKKKPVTQTKPAAAQQSISPVSSSGSIY